jgi:dATP pyrophosphohydrolase
MSRAKYQVFSIPYRQTPQGLLFAIFKRSDEGYWQWTSGGGEGDESIEDAVKRESFEEAGIPLFAHYLKLDTISSIPTEGFAAKKDWPKDLYVLPGYYFSVHLASPTIKLSDEHTDFKWVTYQEAVDLLKWEADKTALWELSERLKLKLNERH